MKCCGDCLALEGELHKENCDWEQCPYCHRQLLSCPKHDWNNIKQEDREPFFSKAFLRCERCGITNYAFFMVSDEDWKKICGKTYDLNKILCKKCMDFIAKKRKIEIKYVLDCQEEYKKLLLENNATTLQDLKNKLMEIENGKRRI